MTDELAVWLHGDHVASIERDRRGPRLTYTDTALGRYQLGTPLLALSLPVAARTYPQGVVRSFLDGLLPEGEAKRAIARDVGEPANDTFGLIRALGRDCAGAATPVPSGSSGSNDTHVSKRLSLECLEFVSRLGWGQPALRPVRNRTCCA